MKTKFRILSNVVLFAISLSVVSFYASEENKKSFTIPLRDSSINIGEMILLEGNYNPITRKYQNSKYEFAGRIWNNIDLSDEEKNEEELHNGELIYYFESSTDTVNHRFGDFVSLRVYNISNELGLGEFDIIPDSFLNDKYLSLAKSTAVPLKILWSK